MAASTATTIAFAQTAVASAAGHSAPAAAVATPAVHSAAATAASAVAPSTLLAAASSSPASAVSLILVACVAGALIAIYYGLQISNMKFDETVASPSHVHVEDKSERYNVTTEVVTQMKKIANAIDIGANAFLMKEYAWIFAFVVFFSILLLALLGSTEGFSRAVYTVLAFVAGCTTSILSGFIGMRIAVIANSRTALEATKGIGPAFRTSFRAGCVMGFGLVSLGLAVLFFLIKIFQANGFKDATSNEKSAAGLYEAIAGYGLGGSSVALFARVAGGIYTKAADVGADLSGKVEQGIPEDDPRNPAVIADNVGDNVGDIAGMGADLFGSFAESTCAALVLASHSPELFKDANAMLYPLCVTAAGLLVCILVSFVASHIITVSSPGEVEPALKQQLLLSTVLNTPVLFVISEAMLPEKFTVEKQAVTRLDLYLCVLAGLWAGLAIGYVTEYFTSNRYQPVQEVAEACKTGAATNIIFGMALGYNSTVIPVTALSSAIYISYTLGNLLGIAMAALGVLSTLAVGLTIDAYGPICDNAGGIAEMAGMEEEVRNTTDALDAAGNTTAAIGKGFAIGSAAFVSLALFGAFVSVVKLSSVNILEPSQFSGLLMGAMLPYWFSAMTMKAVGKAAHQMVEEVRRQFADPRLMSREIEPDYARCVAISTDASLKEMMWPGVLVLGTPVAVGFVFGVKALAGVLAGILVSGVQMAISSANSGGAWDNAKKYIEGKKRALKRRQANNGQREEPEDGNIENAMLIDDEEQYLNDLAHVQTWHEAAVIGDTVGDPLKDTSGPSLNILVKLSAITSLVLGPSFFPAEEGGLLTKLFK